MSRKASGPKMFEFFSSVYTGENAVHIVAFAVNGDLKYKKS